MEEMNQVTVIEDREKQKKRLNENVLKREDTKIKEILKTFGHVVVYNFRKKSKKWSKDVYEGPLFVVERKENPTFKFIIMNRLNTDNFIQDISKIELQVVPPYAFFKNIENNDIKGLWFYDYTETLEFVKTIEDLKRRKITKKKLDFVNDKYDDILTDEIIENTDISSSELSSKEELKKILQNKMNDSNDPFLENLFKKIKLTEKFGDLIN
eukprot:gene2656-3853_t